MRERLSFPTPEEMQDEELLLLDIQAEHSKILEVLGITDKAKEVVGVDNLNTLSRTAVSLTRVIDIQPEENTFLSIMFATPGLGLSGYNTKYSYAPVVQLVGLDLQLKHDFTLADAEIVVEMAAQLRMERELGALPHLGANLATIDNPLTAIMKIER